MLTTDPFELLDRLPDPVEITLEEAKAIIKNLSSHIHRVVSGHAKRNSDGSVTIMSVKVFHWNNGILAEYKIIPEIVIDGDGTIRHVMKIIYDYRGMPGEITIKTEQENSGIRCANLNVFGIKQKVWGPEEEIKEIVDSVELAEEAKQIIIDRLELDGIYVH